MNNTRGEEGIAAEFRWLTIGRKAAIGLN